MSIVSVAKRAGVSVATVSRVINDLQNVRAETAEQVRAAMEALNYTPPAVKRGPKAGSGRRVMPRGMRTGQIAIVNLGGAPHWLAMPVMASVVAGVMRAAKGADIRPVIDEMPDPRVLSPIIRRREVDGVIAFLPSGEFEKDLETLRAHLPTVWLMGGESGVPAVDHVTADNSGIGRLALEYLRGKGCERLAFVTALASVQVMRARGQAFNNAARDAGIEVTNYLLDANDRDAAFYGGNVVHAHSYEDVAERMASAEHRADGVFIAADRTTVGLYPHLLQRGLRPEQGMCVISCDNEHEQLSALRPRPATIDLNSDELGRWAVRQLMHRLRGGDGPAARIQVAPCLIPTDC